MPAVPSSHKLATRTSRSSPATELSTRKACTSAEQIAEPALHGTILELGRIAVIGGGDLDCGAERGLGEGDRHLAEEVRVLATEDLVLLDAQDDVEIAGRRA